MHINTFLYYMTAYHDKINQGGTFTQAELFEEFQRSESEKTVAKLIQETKLIASQLTKEDWEMEPIVLELAQKYGKRHMKRIIDILLIER